jgi:hypothetical protein
VKNDADEGMHVTLSQGFVHGSLQQECKQVDRE